MAVAGAQHGRVWLAAGGAVAYLRSQPMVALLPGAGQPAAVAVVCPLVVAAADTDRAAGPAAGSRIASGGNSLHPRGDPGLVWLLRGEWHPGADDCSLG